jgi:S1-C subfamily serine protease
MDEPTTSRRERLRRRWARLRAGARRVAPVALGMLLAFAAVLLYSIVFPGPRPLTPTEMNAVIAQAMASATPPPPFSERAYQAIAPSLVLIQSRVLTTDGKEDGSLGSGVVLDDAGDILTSLHVVKDAIEILVTFPDGTQSAANLVDQQPENDIAVLRSQHPPAQVVPATLGNPNDVKVGDQAFVVGNPFGLYGSMSAGVISGLNRPFQQPNGGPKMQGLIQFDAAVNPGNSGGPLLNRDGEVIGIVTGLANPTGQDVFIGIGFAVPITTAAAAAGSPPD